MNEHGFIDDKSNIDKLQPIFDIDFGKIYTGMSEFQIKHFVLKRKEFTNDLHLFQQVNTFFDLYYQYQKYLADIELADVTRYVQSILGA